MAMAATMGQQGNPKPVVKQPLYLELPYLSLYLAAGLPAEGARRRIQMMMTGRAKAKVCLCQPSHALHLLPASAAY